MTVIIFVVLFLLKILPLEGNVLTTSYCSVLWAHVHNKCSILSVWGPAAKWQTSSSEVA
jgi:hypothetical protein